MRFLKGADCLKRLYAVVLLQRVLSYVLDCASQALRLVLLAGWASWGMHMTFARAVFPAEVAVVAVEVAGQRHAVRLTRSAGAAGNVCREKDALAVSA